MGTNSSPIYEIVNNLEMTQAKGFYSLFSEYSFRLLISIKFGTFIMFTAGDTNCLSRQVS